MSGPAPALHTRTAAADASACLAVFVRASADDEVRGALDRLGRPDVVGQSDVHGGRHRRPGGDRGQCGGESAVGEHRGCDAPRERTQLGEGLGRLGSGRGEQGAGRLGVVVQATLRDRQVHPEPDQALLGAVVDVPLEAAQRLGLGRCRRGPACLEVLDLRGQHPARDVPVSSSRAQPDVQGGAPPDHRHDGRGEQQPEDEVELGRRSSAGRAARRALVSSATSGDAAASAPRTSRSGRRACRPTRSRRPST